MLNIRSHLAVIITRSVVALNIWSHGYWATEIRLRLLRLVALDIRSHGAVIAIRSLRLVSLRLRSHWSLLIFRSHGTIVWSYWALLNFGSHGTILWPRGTLMTLRSRWMVLTIDVSIFILVLGLESIEPWVRLLLNVGLGVV